MGGDRLFAAIGLVRQARPAGFCPACRLLMKAVDARHELAKPMVAALVVLAVAGVAWAAMIQESRSMAGMDGMDMGHSSVGDVLVHALGLGNQPRSLLVGADLLAHAPDGGT